MSEINEAEFEAEFQDAVETYLSTLGIDIDLSVMGDEEQEDFYDSLDPQIRAGLDQFLEESFLESHFQPMEAAIAWGPVGLLNKAGLVRAAWRAGGIKGLAAGVGAKASGAVRGLLNSRRLMFTGRRGTDPIRGVPARNAAGQFTGGVVSSGYTQTGRTTAGLGAAPERVWDTSTALGSAVTGFRALPPWAQRIPLAAVGGAAALGAAEALGIIGQDEQDEEEELPWTTTPIEESSDLNLNSLSWENHTVDSGNDKFVNWMLDLSLPVGQRISDYDSLASFLANNNAGLVDVTTGQAREDLIEYVRSNENWSQFERFEGLLAEIAGERLDEFGAITQPGGGHYQDGSLPMQWRNVEEPASEEDIDGLLALLGSGIGPRLIAPGAGDPFHGEQFAQIVEAFGRENAAKLMSGVVDEAVERYVDEAAIRNPYMMALTVDGEVVGVFTDFTERSYDGTIGGSVTTLMDVFSGPVGLRVGPGLISQYLKNLEARDKTPGDGSDKVAQIQQSLYAMGYLVDDRGYEMLPDEWGFVDDITIRAMETFQLDLISNYYEATRMGLDPDVNKIYAEMRNQSVRRMRPENVVEPEKAFKQQAISDIRSRIDSALAERGVSLRSTSDAYLNAVNGVLDEMTSAEKEVAFGQGSATPEEVTAASGILQQFYGGSEQWADNIEFGHTNTDPGFINYANKVGALSDEEVNSLTRYSSSPDHTARMRARLGKDVAVSNFLSYLTDDVGNVLPLADASREQIRNAVVLYGNTIGLGYAKRNGIDHRQLRVLADRGFNSMSFTPAEGVTQMLDTVEGRVANAMNVKGRGIGGARYSNLLNVLQDTPARTRRSTIRNV